MKIILVDNYGRETVADIVYAEHVHPWIAEWMVFETQQMIHRRDENVDRWPIVRGDDYRPWRGMEDLV